jgi:hypothetical protein
MIIVGVDFHPAFQEIAFVDTYAGEYILILARGRLERIPKC